MKGVDIDEVFYSVVSNTKRVKNLKLQQGKSISGACIVTLTMNVASTVSKDPKTVNVKIQFLVQERNIWKLKFAKVLGIITVIVLDEEGQCTISDNIITVVAMADIARKIKAKEKYTCSILSLIVKRSVPPFEA